MLSDGLWLASGPRWIVCFAEQCLSIGLVVIVPMWRCCLASVALCLALVFAVLCVLDAIVSIQTLLAVWSAQRVCEIRLCGCVCGFGLDLAKVTISSVY